MEGSIRLPPMGHRKRQGYGCESDAKPLRIVGKGEIRTDLSFTLFYFKTFYEICWGIIGQHEQELTNFLKGFLWWLLDGQ